MYSKEGGEWTVSRFGHFNRRERTPCLNVLAKMFILSLLGVELWSSCRQSDIWAEFSDLFVAIKVIRCAF